MYATYLCRILCGRRSEARCKLPTQVESATEPRPKMGFDGVLSLNWPMWWQPILFWTLLWHTEKVTSRPVIGNAPSQIKSLGEGTCPHAHPKFTRMTDHVEGDGRACDRVSTVVLHWATDPDVFATHEARLLNGPIKRHRALRTTHSQLAVFAYLDLRLNTSPAECRVMWMQQIHHLRQGWYVIVVVCLSVCLSVSNFAQKLPNGFAWNFQGRLVMGQWTDD